MRARRLFAWATAAVVVAAAGCADPVTEIVLVIDTDLAVPAEVAILQISIASPTSQRNFSYGGGFGGDPLPKFPVTLGIVGGAADEPFEVTARLLGALSLPIVQRKAKDVRFVEGETRVLFISLLRACACMGTNCPNPASTPECADLSAPALPLLDPNRLPRVTPSDGGVARDGGTDAPLDGSLDSGGDAPVDRAGDVATDKGVDALADGSGDAATDRAADASSDAAIDRAPDGGADANPPDAGPEVGLRARGQSCTAPTQCVDGFCVDSVCCASACACGTCGGSTPGVCVLAAAGTDPRGVCGSFTCNGAGACETTCAEGFGACSNRCKIGAHCDGQGKCVASTTEAGFFCVVGSCLCKAGLSCPAPDGGGAGLCR